MAKAAIIYWSGTGNTEAMANLIAEGAKAAGAEVDIFAPDDFDASKANGYSSIAFGCPAMGAEQLEEMEFEPMWESVKNCLDGKRIFLFGSYGWGDGEWMRSWEENAPCAIEETFICNDAPDAEAETALKAIGAQMA